MTTVNVKREVRSRTGASLTARVTAASDASELRTDYWDGYYSGSSTTKRPLPSQFATFVAGEFATPHRIVELGSGSGRDSIFFASHGHRVLGIDGSAQAVARSRTLAENLGNPAEFLASPVDSPTLSAQLSTSELATLVYARFFVHAITDREEGDFLDLAAAITRTGDVLAVEYRTVRDQPGTKVTGTHYRRFVQPSAFEAQAFGRGFDVTYAVEGYGFAKYADDDAYVARTLFRRR